jgi:hypothetical protein
VQWHNNRRQAKNQQNQQSRCMLPAKKYIGLRAMSVIENARNAVFTQLNQRLLAAAFSDDLFTFNG